MIIRSPEEKRLAELFEECRRIQKYHVIFTDIASFGLTWVSRKLNERRNG